jgi:hypothetical protein
MEHLKRKLNRLQNELCKELTELTDVKETIQEIKKLEKELKEKKQKAILKQVNKDHEKKRAILKDLFSVNFPNEDITTNDKSFHATKVKKYPNLAKYKYIRADIKRNEQNELFYEDITINGDRFKLINYHYKGSETNYSYIDTFEELLKVNGIKEKPVKWSEFIKTQKATIRAAEKVKKAIEKYEEEIKKTDRYFFECNNLLSRFKETIYTYQ